MGRTDFWDSCTADGRCADWDFTADDKGTFWCAGRIRWREYCLQRDNHSTGRRCGTLWTITSLCRSTSAFGTGRTWIRNAVCSRVQWRYSGQKLAAACSDTSGREGAQRCADRFTDHGYEDYADFRTCTPETYGRRRFSSGNLSCSASGIKESRQHSSGAILWIPNGTSIRKCRTSYDGYPKYVRQIRNTDDRRRDNSADRKCTGVPDAWISERIHCLYRWTWKNGSFVERLWYLS